MQMQLLVLAGRREAPAPAAYQKFFRKLALPCSSWCLRATAEEVGSQDPGARPRPLRLSSRLGSDWDSGSCLGRGSSVGVLVGAPSPGLQQRVQEGLTAAELLREKVRQPGVGRLCCCCCCCCIW